MEMQIPTIGEIIFCGIILGRTSDEKVFASLVRARNCSSPMKRGVSGCGFFNDAIKSSAA